MVEKMIGQVDVTTFGGGSTQVENAESDQVLVALDG